MNIISLCLFRLFTGLLQGSLKAVVCFQAPSSLSTGCIDEPHLRRFPVQGHILSTGGDALSTSLTTSTSLVCSKVNNQPPTLVVTISSPFSPDLWQILFSEVEHDN